ncbi:MAG: zinc-binding dehydrogenase [Deltaproteobacteria bacterium]|nr:MAG: zinc-binding dehydrogenase [Deltaproteobacteria bacterium]
MKAIAVFPKAKEVQLIDAELPALTSPTHVRLQMLDVGVCGTDREICAFQYGTPPSGSDHLIIGHESLARVVEVGPQVRTRRVGELVVPMVRRPCPHDHCTACRSGRQDFCFTGDFRERGIGGAHGFMTESVVEDERYLNPVPEALREVAILVEPLTIAEKALIQLWHLQERLPWQCPHRPGKDHGHCRRALVLGAGPVGLLGAMALRARDFETIVYAREAAPNEKSAVAEAIGASYVSSTDVPPAEIAARYGAIDVVYEAAGASKVAFDTMQALGANSIFVFTGVPGRKGPVEIDTDLVMRNLVLRNQMILGTVNAGRDAFEAAIRDVAEFGRRWPAALRALISGRHTPEEFRELLLGRPTGIKHVISFAEN